MYRLVIVSGPNRGSAYNLIEGENSIGRQMDNHIVLTSSKVSKRHCSLLVTPNEVFFRDESSTNGTFVNGALVKKQPLKPGDKISVGEFVLELAKAGASINSLMPFQGAGLGTSPMMNGSLALSHDHQVGMQPHLSAVPQYQPHEAAVEAPQDLQGKIEFAFENKLMPFFYGMLMKNEYRSIMAILFGFLTVVAVVGAIMPMQDLSEQSIQREAMYRAKILSREIADRNLPLIAAHTESQIDLSLLEGEETVKLAVITNLDLQIIAPQSRLNQMLAGGPEIPYVIRASKAFQDGLDRGTGGIINGSIALWIEPIKTTDPKEVKTRTAGMSIVAIDFSRNMISDGGLGVTYGIGFVIAGLAATLVYFILLRLSLKPYEVLDEDLDQVLRGELPKVTHEFKIAELDSLWNNVNATVLRVPKTSGEAFEAENTVVNWDHEVTAVRALAESARSGFVGFDSALMVVAMNPFFEEVSGIRVETLGQSLSQMARDQAFVSLVKDLYDRVGTSPSRSALDDFEFSGVSYVVIGVGVGPPRDPGMCVVFKKKE